MSLLAKLIAASAQPLTAPSLAPVAPAPDPAYAAYVAAVEAGNRKRAACKRCGGQGYLREYAHINGGVCFSCGGNAARPHPVMSYAEWLAERAAELELDGFAVMVQE
jgi:ribosomal protein L37E